MTKRKKIERKLIAGVKHKRIPCLTCGQLIWVANDLYKLHARCTECMGLGGLYGVGRDNQGKEKE